MTATYAEGHRFRGKMAEAGTHYGLEVVVDEAPPMGYGYAAKAVDIEEQKRPKPRKMTSIEYVGPCTLVLVNHTKSAASTPLTSRHRNVDLGE